MSQPPYQPGGVPPVPPAAPTQVVYPGQGQLPPQPQFAPSAQQAAAGSPQYAVGFPNYVSPPPSPPNRTSLIVGSIAVAVVLLFAVIGFVLVSGRGANSPEAAVQTYLDAINDQDYGRAYDQLCESARSEISEQAIRDALSSVTVPGGQLLSDVETTGSSDTVVDGREGSTVTVRFTALGQPTETDVFVVDESGWRVCGGDLTDF